VDISTIEIRNHPQNPDHQLYVVVVVVDDDENLVIIKLELFFGGIVYEIC